MFFRAPGCVLLFYYFVWICYKSFQTFSACSHTFLRLLLLKHFVLSLSNLLLNFVRVALRWSAHCQKNVTLKVAYFSVWSQRVINSFQISMYTAALSAKIVLTDRDVFRITCFRSKNLKFVDITDWFDCRASDSFPPRSLARMFAEFFLLPIKSASTLSSNHYTKLMLPQVDGC